MNIPNYFTCLRILLIPGFMLAYYLPFSWGHGLSAGIFAFAAATDWLDGYLARVLNQTTKLGAFLDPVADKLMVVTALVLVVSQLDIPYLAIPAAVIVGREIVISALREWMAEIGKRMSVAVSFIGKVKTTMQMLSLIFLLLGYTKLILLIGATLLYVAAILTLWSMVMYLRAAWPDLTLSAEKE